jgi:hypothetical protein
MKLKRLDIFSGPSFPINIDRIRWLGATFGLKEAIAAMNTLARETPGRYFVSNQRFARSTS